MKQRLTLITRKSNQIFNKLIRIKSCDYSDVYVLATGNITVVGANNNTKVAFKNCTPFRKFRTEINETCIDEVEHANTTMPMYNLIEYSDSCCASICNNCPNL